MGPKESKTAQSSGPLYLTSGQVDLATGRVSTSSGEQRQLRELERQVLAYLARRAGQAVAQEELLREVWGYDTRVVTRTVYTTIRRLRRQIEPDPARPIHVVTQRGEGYQFVPHRPSRPATPPDIIGRDRELDEVRARFAAGHRLVSILGPAGMGKTCLATAVAATSDRPTTMVDLSSVSTVPALVAAILTALDLPDVGPDTTSERLGEHLSTRGRRRLVLDNFEHLVPVAATALARWHRDAPDMQFLVTSQVALRLKDESVLELGPLPLEAARTLLVQRATRAGHLPPVDDAEAVDDIVRHLEGIPLALELAASRLRILTASGLLRRLQDGPEVLRAAWRDGVERHHSMTAALESTWQLLQQPARDAAAQCTVFAGSFDADAFGEVVRVSGAGPLDVLDDLKDHSWVRLREGRLSMFDSMRRHARSNLPAASAVFARHADWAMAQPGSLDTVAELSAVVDHFVAVEPTRAARAAVRASDILEPIGHSELKCEILERVVAASTRIDAELAFAVGRRHVSALRALLCFDRCHEQLETLRPLAVSLGSEAHGAWWHLVGAVHLHSGRPAEAEAALTEARNRLEPGGPGRDLGRVLSALGILRQLQGRTEDAAVTLREAVAMLEHYGTPHDHATASCNLAAMLVGQWPEMARAARQAIEVSGRHDRHTEAVSLGHLALALHESGNAAEAIPTFEQSLEQLDAMGDTRIRSRVMANYGLALYSIGDHEGAVECLQDCVVAHETHGDALSRRLALGNLGILESAAGRTADAEAHLREALATFEQYPAPKAHQVALSAHLVALLVGLGRSAEAEEWLATGQEALADDDPYSAALLDVAHTMRALAAAPTAATRDRAAELRAQEPKGWDHGVLLAQLGQRADRA